MPQLYAITTVYNPAGYQSRFRLYREFAKRLEKSGVALYTVELATGDQDFAVTDAEDPRHIRLRSPHTLWYKENLINIAIARLPRDWEYVAWLDADIQFLRPDWVTQTIAELQQRAFVQLFSHMVDLGPNFEVLGVSESVALRVARGAGQEEALQGSSGFAWAARRRELEALGGLNDWSIVGSDDYFFARGLIGAITPDSTRRPGSAFANKYLEWQARCRMHFDGQIGYVRSAIAHFWHGRQSDRGYTTRWKLLVDNDFDPDIDLTRDDVGLYRFSGNKPRLQEAIFDYFRSRDEDATELDRTGHAKI